MNTEYDPRARRLNPLIDELIATLDEHWRFLLSSQDFLERKGRLRVVRQIIDRILDEPEWLEADLQQGAATAEDCWFAPGEFAGEAAPEFLDERPFDEPGPARGLCFLYADTGKLSHLYRGEPVNPDIGPLRQHGPYVYTLEKHLATAAETSHRVINAHLWSELVPAHGGSGDEAGERWLVLCDPRGIGGGERSVCVGSYGDGEHAVAVAEALAQQLGIRFVVARERRRWCTR